MVVFMIIIDRSNTQNDFENGSGDNNNKDTSKK